MVVSKVEQIIGLRLKLLNLSTKKKKKKERR